MHCDNSSLAHLSVDVLTTRIGQLLSREREAMLEFLLHLAELDRRRHYLELGYSSTFAYCSEGLRLSKASSYRRSTAVALLRKFPVIGSFLSSGRLSLTSLCHLRHVLDEETHLALLERASGLNEDAVEHLAASLNARAAGKDSLRKVPAPHSAPAPVLPPVAEAAQP